jgi:hypothetical protein
MLLNGCFVYGVIPKSQHGGSKAQTQAWGRQGGGSEIGHRWSPPQGKIQQPRIEGKAPLAGGIYRSDPTDSSAVGSRWPDPPAATDGGAALNYIVAGDGSGVVAPRSQRPARRGEGGCMMDDGPQGGGHREVARGLRAAEFPTQPAHGTNGHRVACQDKLRWGKIHSGANRSDGKRRTAKIKRSPMVQLRRNPSASGPAIQVGLCLGGRPLARAEPGWGALRWGGAECRERARDG